MSAVKRTVMSPDYMVKAWATRSGNDSEDDDSALFGERGEGERRPDEIVEAWATRSGNESDTTIQLSLVREGSVAGAWKSSPQAAKL